MTISWDVWQTILLFLIFVVLVRLLRRPAPAPEMEKNEGPEQRIRKNLSTEAGYAVLRVLASSDSAEKKLASIEYELKRAILWNRWAIGEDETEEVLKPYDLVSFSRNIRYDPGDYARSPEPI